MDSAGKRETRPPDRLIDSLFQPDKINMPLTTNTTTSNPTSTTSTIPTTSTTMVHTTSVGTMSVSKPKPSATEPPKKEPSVQSLLQQMMTKMSENQSRTEEQLKALHQKADEGSAHCIHRYQLTDPRLTKLEDESVLVESHMSQQITTNQCTDNRLTTLEIEMIQMRKEISRISSQQPMSTNHDLSQILKPNVLSSTTVPTNLSSQNNVSSVTPQGQTNHFVNTFDSQKSSFQVQERFQDTVSEFSGQIKVMHPQKFIGQVDAYFDSVFVSPPQQLISAHRRLVGDAQIWYESLIPSPR